MKVLVTGGLGFIGSETVVNLIKKKYECVIVDNLFNSKKTVLDRIKKITGVKPKFYLADVNNLKKMDQIFKKEKFEAIIHFAGYKAVSESVVKPLEYYQNNIGTTLNLLELMRKYKVLNFVFSSSATVYGEPTKIPVTEESEVKKATNPYGESKIINENILMDFQKAYPEFNITLLRYFNPIGADPSGLLGEDPNGIPNNLFPIINNVVLGKQECLKVTGSDYKTKDGTGVRDYIHVVDLAVGHVLALKKMKGLKIYNLGQGKGYSVLDLVNAYQEVNKIKIKYEFAPRRMGDIAEIYADCTKAKKELGFTCKYDIKDACRHGYKFLKNK